MSDRTPSSNEMSSNSAGGGRKHFHPPREVLFDRFLAGAIVDYADTHIQRLILTDEGGPDSTSKDVSPAALTRYRDLLHEEKRLLKDWGSNQLERMMVDEARAKGVTYCKSADRTKEIVSTWPHVMASWEGDGSLVNASLMFHVMYGVFDQSRSTNWALTLEQDYMKRMNYTYAGSKKVGGYISRLMTERRSELHKNLRRKSKTTHKRTLSISSSAGSRKKRRGKGIFDPEFLKFTSDSFQSGYYGSRDVIVGMVGVTQLGEEQVSSGDEAVKELENQIAALRAEKKRVSHLYLCCGWCSSCSLRIAQKGCCCSSRWWKGKLGG